MVPTSPLIDPQCLDGQYRETLPPANADISALSSDYSPDAWRAYVEGVLRARYPLGWTIVEDALVGSAPDTGDTVEAFTDFIDRLLTQVDSSPSGAPSCPHSREGRAFLGLGLCVRHGYPVPA